jgi:hypothetical protein
MNQLAVTMADRWGDHHTLRYRLYDADIVHRWRDCTKLLLDHAAEIKTVWHNHQHSDLPRISQQLRDVVAEINLSYDQEIAAVGEIDQQVLNDLHTRFEQFAQRQQQGQHWPTDLGELFLALNETIHQWESAAQNSLRGNHGSYSCLYDLAPGSVYHKLAERDLLLLEADKQWGGLYLGYATVGKDWFATFLDRDLALIAQSQVTVQERFSAETLLCFNTGQSAHTHASQLMSWARGLAPELRDRIPLDDISALRFGKIRLGDIIIDDQFLALDPDPWHWRAQGHPCRLLWNRCVFAQMRSIVSIHID